MTTLLHHRSRARLLAGDALFMLTIVPFSLGLAYIFGFQTFTNWFIGIICGVNLVLHAHTFYEIWRQPHGFRCELDAHSIRCLCPAPSMGGSFDLPLSDLREIVVDKDGPRVELVDVRQARHKLTFNFGNPAWRFVDRLRQIRPDAIYTEK